MTIQKVLECDSVEALESLRQVIDNPVLEEHIGYTDEMKLKDAMEVLDRLITDLKTADKE